MSLTLSLTPSNIPPTDFAPKAVPVYAGLAELVDVDAGTSPNGRPENLMILGFRVGDKMRLRIGIRDESDHDDGALDFEAVRRAAWIQRRVLLRFPFDGVEPHVARASWIEILAKVIGKRLGVESGAAR